MISRRQILSSGVAASLSRWHAGGAAAGAKSNIVLILADDLGYGDLGINGHPTIRTPYLDRMCAEGVKFTNFYSAACVCTPSRAALLTGRYPIRSGLIRVLYPGDEFGISDSEVTLGQALERQGYATACIGKWHLGDLPPYHPNRHGFEHYYGLLYSNDMDPQRLYRNKELVESPVNQTTLTERYTIEAQRFIRQNRERPFFLYLPHTMPHAPWAASEKFSGKSKHGIYGDAVEELDWSTGEILRTLRETGLDRNTLVIFTSDNGASMGGKRTGGGSNGLFRGGKFTAWEGGYRMPFLARWPGRIPAGTVRSDIACTMDLFTTAVELAGGKPPADRVIDGFNIASVLEGAGESPRKDLYYFTYPLTSKFQLAAVRSGKWKLHFRKRDDFAGGPGVFESGPLYNLDRDPSENIDESGNQPEALARLTAQAKEFYGGLERVKLCPPLAGNSGDRLRNLGTPP